MISEMFQQEDLNFLLTNRLPRRTATRLLGRFSRIENPLLVAASLRVWKLFAPELDLSEAHATRFGSLRDVFIRELKPDARPVYPGTEIVVSPCDSIVGTCGRIHDDVVLQAKGRSYPLSELVRDEELVARHRDGLFVTLRLKSTMYHRFHAPTDCRIRAVDYISGDTWNVNPVALARVDRLFCRNERAVVPLELDTLSAQITLVPVAAIGVATLHLHCLGGTLDLGYAGPRKISCDAAYAKGDELGWFEQGSTIIVLANGDLELADGIEEGRRLKVGEPLFKASKAREGAAPTAGDVEEV